MAKEKLSEGFFNEILEFGFDKATNGVLGFVSAQELAKDYLKQCEDPVACAKSLVRWQMFKASVSGFLSGVGGGLLLPVTITANISTVLVLQLRMISAIAVMGGYDVKDDRVKALITLCLVGKGASDVLKQVGVKSSQQITTSVIQSISSTSLIKINQKVGFRLFTKFGSSGVINLSRLIPIIGGVVMAIFDLSSTKAVGNFAIRTFLKGSASKR